MLNFCSNITPTSGDVMGCPSRDITTGDNSPPPHTARGCEGTGENRWLRVTPSSLKFSRDDASLQMAKLVLWNKSKKRLDFRLRMASHQNHFDLICEKTVIYGGSTETVLVKVRPYDLRLICTFLKIQIGTDWHGGVDMDESNDTELSIPVELFPNTSWFQLPRFVIMPTVPIGQSFQAVLPLPTVPDENGLYFFISHGNTPAISVSPTEGTIGPGPTSGIDSLQINYHPRDYTTIAHTLYIHFPLIQKRPYEITLYLKSNPTTYDQMEGCDMFPPIKKQPLKSTKLKTPQEVKVKPEGTGRMVEETEDLTTAGAVAKFLIRPARTSASTTDLIGPTGLTAYEEHKGYKMAEKGFYEKVAQFQTLQRNLNLQPSRAYGGELAVDEESERWRAIVTERETHKYLYAKSLGLATNHLEDLTRDQTQVGRRRGLRDLDKTWVPSVLKSLSLSYDPVRQYVLRPFIQAGLGIITRARADKRIVKLRLLGKLKRQEMAIAPI